MGSFPTAAMRPEDRAGALLLRFANDSSIVLANVLSDEFFPSVQGLGGSKKQPRSKQKGKKKARRRRFIRFVEVQCNGFCSRRLPRKHRSNWKRGAAAP